MSMFELERLFQDLMRRVHVLEVTQPMGYSSVSEGRSRFAGNESVLVQGSGKVEGWWIVTGTQRVTGLLEGSGTLDWTGPCNLKGKVTVTGNTDFIGRLTTTGDVELGGNTVIKKDLDVQAKTRLRGKTTVEDDLEVLPGGKIKIGDMTIDPSGGSGRVRFANGGQVWAESNAIKMMIGTHAVSVSNGSVLIASSGFAVEVGSAGVKIVGTLPQTNAAGVPKGTLIRGAGGTLYEAS